MDQPKCRWGHQLKVPWCTFKSLIIFQFQKGFRVCLFWILYFNLGIWKKKCIQQMHRCIQLEYTTWTWNIQIFQLLDNTARYYNEVHFYYFIIDRFELWSHYISYWKHFWEISYRKDTLLKGVPNSFWMSRGSNSHRWERCGKKPYTLPTVLLGRSLLVSDRNDKLRFIKMVAIKSVMRRIFIYELFWNRIV